MFRFIAILTLMIAMVLPALAQHPEEIDTVKVIENPSRVTVTRNGEVTTIKVEKETGLMVDTFYYNVQVTPQDPNSYLKDYDWDIDLSFLGVINKKESPHRSRRALRTSLMFMKGGYMGYRFNYSGKDHVKNSYEVGFRNIVGLCWDHGKHTPSFSIGLGLGTQRYNAMDGFVYTKEGSDIMLIPIAAGMERKSSYMYIMNFQIPLMFTLPLGNQMQFSLGAIGNFNSYAAAVTELKKDNVKIKSNYKGIQQRLFTPELVCSLGFTDFIGVYASWSPVSQFQAPYGPKLKSWSIGGTLIF